MILSLFDLNGLVVFEKNTVTDNHINYRVCDMIDPNLSFLKSEENYKVQRKAVIGIQGYATNTVIAFNKFHRNSGTKGILYFEYYTK